MDSKQSLKEMIFARARPGELYEKLPDGKLQCYACGHLCKIAEGHAGVCLVRFNKQGQLQVPFGYVGALQCDPIEKKPFFHVLPGAQALSFGMLGCDFHCAYCQNWLTSQALRDPAAGTLPETVSPEDLIHMARESKAQVIASTYNEPLITGEWAVAIFKQAKAAGFKTAFISNGNATEKALDYLKPWVDLYKVDLKSFDEKRYRELGGQLQNILNTIRMLKEKGFWLEVVTLCIPGFNDSDEEIRKMAEFLMSVSPDIPWHVTAFHQDYRMTDKDNTSVKTLLKAANIGKEAGLQFVYAGNLPGQVGNLENTYCPGCKNLLIERYGFRILKNRLQKGKCPDCQKVIPGIWN
jgi:pyruvate formate lyase activating enzyme